MDTDEYDAEAEWEAAQIWCSHCDGLGHTAERCPAPVW
jgi:hypothetical protein